MSTDYQRAREELGRRLREMRVNSAEGRLTGIQLAQRLGWQQSKVSKLENGRQTPTDDDLLAWAEATGHAAAFDELRARLKGFESHIRSWRRQLAAGHAPVQESWNTLVSNATAVHALSNAAVNGMLQTPDYARHVFERHSGLWESPRDTEAAVRARMKRQEWLYRPGKLLNVLMPEAVLRARICSPEVLAAQLDRLLGVVGMDTVNLGILPMDGPLPLALGNSFTVLDDRLAVVEDWHAELWLDDAETIALYPPRLGHLRRGRRLRPGGAAGDRAGAAEHGGVTGGASRAGGRPHNSLGLPSAERRTGTRHRGAAAP